MINWCCSGKSLLTSLEFADRVINVRHKYNSLFCTHIFYGQTRETSLNPQPRGNTLRKSYPGGFVGKFLVWRWSLVFMLQYYAKFVLCPNYCAWVAMKETCKGSGGWKSRFITFTTRKYSRHTMWWNGRRKKYFPPLFLQTPVAPPYPNCIHLIYPPLFFSLAAKVEKENSQIHSHTEDNSLCFPTGRTLTTLPSHFATKRHPSFRRWFGFSNVVASSLWCAGVSSFHNFSHGARTRHGEQGRGHTLWHVDRQVFTKYSLSRISCKNVTSMCS